MTIVHKKAKKKNGNIKVYRRSLQPFKTRTQEQGYTRNSNKDTFVLILQNIESKVFFLIYKKKPCHSL